MKKYTLLVFVLVIALALAACGTGTTKPAASEAKADTAAPAEATTEPAASEAKVETEAPAEAATEPAVGMPNPNKYGVTADEMTSAVGFPVNVPANAENISYNILGYAGEHPVAEVTFTLSGKEYTLRASAAALTSVFKADSENTVENADLEAINISGIFGEWKAVSVASVSYCNAVYMTCDGNSVLAWLDAVPGILYNLTVSGELSTADVEAFAGIAAECFVPAQGDA